MKIFFGSVLYISRLRESNLRQQLQHDLIYNMNNKILHILKDHNLYKLHFL